MSNLARQGDDHPEAAAKHLDDAAALLAARRYDGAGYLAGYVLECAFKTIIILEEIAQTAGLTPTTLAADLKTGGPAINAGLESGMKKALKLKHDLDKLSKEALRLASLSGAATAKYAPSTAAGAIYAGALTESIRYHKPGSVGATVASQWHIEAKIVYESTVAEMRRDGVVTF